MQEVNNYNVPTAWLDFIRWIATIAVITIHVAAPYLYKYGSIPMLYWNFYNFIDSLTRFAVPFFVMLSGALLLNRNDSLKDFLFKRFSRVLIPFLFWSIIYSIYHFYIVNSNFGFEYIAFFVKSLNEGASYHFWYIYMLIGLYLAIPVLRVFVQNAQTNLIQYFLLLWFFFLLFSFFEITFNKDFNWTIYTGYVGYLILGYFIAFRLGNINSHLVLSIFFVALLFTFIMTWQFPICKGVFNGKYYQYLCVNVVTCAASLFILIKKHFRMAEKSLSKLQFCNKYGFGVYFIHVLILDILQYFGINGAFVNPFVGIITTVLLCYISSLLLIRFFTSSKLLAQIIN